MKQRINHVTNSSSSSFIISRNDITKDRLIDILLEIANKELKFWDEEDDYKYTLEEDVYEETETDSEYYPETKMFRDYERIKTVVASRYIITECTEDDPYTDWVCNTYNNHYYIDNESCGRYEWNVIDKILSKYNVSWKRGYCD